MRLERVMNRFRNRAKTMTPNCLHRQLFNTKRIRKKRKNVRESSESKKSRSLLPKLKQKPKLLQLQLLPKLKLNVWPKKSKNELKRSSSKRNNKKLKLLQLPLLPLPPS